jgi:Zn-finger nucleic acid-binding protein
MRCPIDNAELIMTDRNGVEIDYCPTCRGVWLDRGELDKIIERAAGPPSACTCASARGPSL